ncbi:MAG: ribosome silencing factor [Gammaproteobacteria bacterium]|nr:ribosome silencing factor [Gammaproteobacteria bacterium]TVQ49294.1 MAG: ribosome silencing factor [Gammaproteobacteria bacterium]
MQSEEIKDLVLAALDDAKGEQVRVLDVRELTSITDWMVVVSGRSDRHVKALSDAVLERARDIGVRPIGVEGQRGGEWVLVDFADVLVHVMLPRIREFYNLEKLWDIGKTAVTASPGRLEAQGASRER